MDIVNLAVKVATSDIDKAVSGLNTLQRELDRTESGAYKFGAAIGGTAKLAAAAFIGVATSVSTLAIVMANHIDDLQDLANMYGYSVTQISAMKTAAEDAGGTLEDVMKSASKARVEVAKGGEAFKNLGVSMYDTNGHLKTGVELATEVAVKYRDGSTAAANYDDVVKVLGKDVDKMAAVLASQADAQALVNELQEKGIGIVEGAVDATDNFSKAKNRANLVMESAGSILVAKLIPSFTLLINSLTDSYVNGGLVREMFDGLIGMLPGLIGFGGTVTKVFVTIANTVRAFGDTLGAAGAIIASLVSGDFTGAWTIAKAWKENVDSIDEQNVRAMKGIDEVIAKMQQATVNAKTTLANPGGGRGSNGPAGGRGSNGPAGVSDKKAKTPGRNTGLFDLGGYDDLAAVDKLAAQDRMKQREEDEKSRQKDLARIQIEAEKTFEPMREAGMMAFQSLSSALMDFTVGGEFSFKKFLSTFLKGIAQMIIQLTLITPLMEAFNKSFAKSGTGGGWGSLFTNVIGAFAGGRAVGGNVDAGKSYLVGEDGPELLNMGRSSGSIVPNHALGGNSQTNIINVTVNGGQTNNETGNAVSQAILNTMRGIARQEIKGSTRTGGMLNPI